MKYRIDMYDINNIKRVAFFKTLESATKFKISLVKRSHALDDCNILFNSSYIIQVGAIENV